MEHEGVIAYRCHACNWMPRRETIEMLIRLGRSIEPGVVYLVELLTVKQEIPISGSFSHYSHKGNMRSMHGYVSQEYTTSTPSSGSYTPSPGKDSFH